MKTSRLSRVALAALFSLPLGCSGREGAPCDGAALARVRELCRVEPAGEPTYRICDEAGLKPPAGFDFETPEVEACSAVGAGEWISCMAARASECRVTDRGVDFASVVTLQRSCTPRTLATFPGSSSASFDECTQTLEACLARCDTSSWEACAGCEASCQLSFGRCCS